MDWVPSSDLVLHIYIPILVSIFIFLLALAWDSSINNTIRFFSSREELEENLVNILRNETIMKWIFTIVLTVIIILIVYLGRDHLPSAFQKEHGSPEEPGMDLSPVADLSGMARV